MKFDRIARVEELPDLAVFMLVGEYWEYCRKSHYDTPALAGAIGERHVVLIPKGTKVAVLRAGENADAH